MTNHTLHHQTLNDLTYLAGQIAPTLKRYDVIALQGTLGTGKTTFAKALIGNLCHKSQPEVTSPTFSIMHPYVTDHGLSLYHFDLYRLENLDEILECGIEDALDDGISLIEWPEKAFSLLTDHTIYITLEKETDEEDVRTITIQSAAHPLDFL